MEIKNKFIATAILVLCGASASWPSLAQDKTSGTSAAASSSAAGQAAQATSADARVSEIIGKQVKNSKDENLGKIEDIVIDVDHGKAQYAVLSFGGMLGLGDKLFAIPVSALKPGKERNQFLLNVDKEQLKKAPGFELGRGPNYSAETYRNQVDQFFFKEELTRHTPSNAHLMGADDLIGKNINDRAAHNTGKIADIVMNFDSGRAYAVMDADKGITSKGKLLPMPLNAFSFPTRPDLDPMLNVDQKTIDTARGFEGGKWPDMRSAQYQKTVNDQLASIQSQVKSSPNVTQTGRETAGSSSSGESSSGASSGGSK